MTADHEAGQDDGVPDGLSNLGDMDPGSMNLGGMGGMDLGGLLESAQNAMAAQADAASQVVEGTSGGGVVHVTMTGAGEVTKVSLAAEVVDPSDVEMLEDLIVAALADASTKVTALQREALGAFGQVDLGGGGPGGLGGLLGGSSDQPER